MDEAARNELLAHVKRAILEVEPGATVLLYGSRARGDAREDSDWDFLVLLEGPVDQRREEQIWQRVYPVELNTGQVISTVFNSCQGWRDSTAMWTPYRENVQREGVEI